MKTTQNSVRVQTGPQMNPNEENTTRSSNTTHRTVHGSRARSLTGHQSERDSTTGPPLAHRIPRGLPATGRTLRNQHQVTHRGGSRPPTTPGAVSSECTVQARGRLNGRGDCGVRGGEVGGTTKRTRYRRDGDGNGSGWGGDWGVVTLA
jgi:hypothetical protein